MDLTSKLIGIAITACGTSNYNKDNLCVDANVYDKI